MIKSIFLALGLFSLEPREQVNIPILSPIETSHSISSKFGYRTHPVTGARKSMHNGLDFRAPKGTPIVATAAGVISYSGRKGSYGNFIEINHGGKITTRYAHMSKIKIDANRKVKRGEVIGLVGSTGRSTGNHLHYEIRLEGEPLNPASFIMNEKTK